MEDNLVVMLNPAQDKYDRLYEAHEKLQHLNQVLEDKLLKLAENHHSTTTQMTGQIHNLTERLVEARLYISQLEDENERYRNDINIVIQLLQCKPSSFVPSKIESLPEDLQRKVLGLRTNGPRDPLGFGFKKKSEKKIIKVQVPTYSMKTDIMYSIEKDNKTKELQTNGSSAKDRIISAAIMAKVLAERERERDENSRGRCACASRIILPTIDRETQTLPTCTISCVDLELGAQEPLVSSASTSSYSSTSSSLSSSHAQSPTNCQWSSSSSAIGAGAYQQRVSGRPDSLNFRTYGPMVHRPVSVASGGSWSSTVLVQRAPRDYTSASPSALNSPKDIENEDEGDCGCNDPYRVGDGADEFSPNGPASQAYNYRPHKRSFWTRSSSTTSTETEI